MIFKYKFDVLWYDFIRCWFIRLLISKWNAFIKPKRPIGYKEVGSIFVGYIVLIKIEEICNVERIFDLSKDIITIRSWLLPWKKYSYLCVGEHAVNSSFYAMYAQRELPFKGDMSMSPEEWGEELLKMMNKQRELKSVWFVPASPKRGKLKVRPNLVYNINQI